MKKKKQKLSYVLGLLALLGFLLGFFQMFIWSYAQKDIEKALITSLYFAILTSFTITGFYIGIYRTWLGQPKYKIVFEVMVEQSLLPIVLSALICFLSNILTSIVTVVVFWFEGIMQLEKIFSSALEFGIASNFISFFVSAALAGSYPEIQEYKRHAKRLITILAILAATALLALHLMWTSGKYDAFFGASTTVSFVSFISVLRDNGMRDLSCNSFL